MNLNALARLDSADLDTLIMLVRDYRDSVGDGTTSGFHQPQMYELADANALLAKLEEAHR